MSSGLYGSEEFEKLLQEENVLDGAFECLRRIWTDTDALGDRRLTESEYQTRLLERELEKIYPPLYDDLREQMGGHPITELDDGCGVIMDALSLREGFRLEQELADEHDWSVSLSWAPIERLPSETKFICQEWFDAQGPSAVSRDDFRFIGDLDVPKLPGTSPEYVWTRHPDQRLEGALKGNYSMEEVEDIYKDVKRLLEDIVHGSGHDEFLVTSDHGYVNHLGNSPYSLTDEQEEALSSKFSSRFREVANGQAYQLLEQAKIIERVREHYMVRGHYRWTKRGATKKIMHGGFSLPECMTPVLRITT
ncbi:hypothetical protein LPA44_09650 [Halobacterium sp. KA-4]|uniref:hypothetical protein n=1 Tax=Halobacterium sp. KA-4 TaxID=2896367 RepID=UPI001E4E717F|nr:hypothetical protein [Halobacterium sp. KA-4]MCD2200163.1 hypothetical protein [Halobacterium sp. KA-4]